MDAEAIRKQTRRLAIGAIAVVAGAGFAAPLPAAATPSCTQTQCTVFFTGPGGFGISQSDAEFLQTELGIPLFPPSSVDSLDEMLRVASIDFDQRDDLTPFPPSTTGPDFADSAWTVQNVSGEPLIGDLFFLFASVVNQFEFEGETIRYGDDEVALILRANQSWEIVLSAGGRFYPAVRIASLATGGLSDAIPVRFLVVGGLETTAPNRLVLPQFLVGSAFTPIPEPSSALLLALGLAAIAAGRSRLH